MNNNMFKQSNLWKDISERFDKNNNLSLNDLKQGIFNQNIAYWNPASNGDRYFKTLLWNLASSLDKEDLNTLSNTKHRDYGNPSVIYYAGQYLDLDYIQSVFEFKAIRKFLDAKPLRFLEIGAGYGRTAHVIIQNANILNYTIIDLPSTLILSRQYLSEVLTRDQFNKLTFISTDCLNSEKGFNQFIQGDEYFDWTINIDSFAEMDIQIVKNYLSMIDVKSNFLYTKNPVGKYERWMISKDDTNLNQKAVENAMSTGMIQDIVNINSQDEIIMASKNFIQAYKPSSRWSVRFDQWAKPWHYYWEAIYERKN